MLLTLYKKQTTNIPWRLLVTLHKVSLQKQLVYKHKPVWKKMLENVRCNNHDILANVCEQ